MWISNGKSSDLHEHLVRLRKAVKKARVGRSTIYKSQDIETTEMAINKGMGKEDVLHGRRALRLSH